jgi:hypothetical protein
MVDSYRSLGGVRRIVTGAADGMPSGVERRRAVGCRTGVRDPRAPSSTALMRTPPWMGSASGRDALLLSGKGSRYAMVS